MTVIPFRARAQRLRPAAHATGGARPFRPALSPGRCRSTPAEDRLRMQQNVGALIAVLLIVVLGAWLIDRLTTYSRTLACIEAGHRNCATLDIQQPRPW